MEEIENSVGFIVVERTLQIVLWTSIKQVAEQVSLKKAIDKIEA